MKTIALLSGGKDSILAVLMAYRYGHEPAVIVNIVPALPGDAETDTTEAVNGHDIDSYMYQTVGFEALDSIAACLQLPLRRAAVKRGRAKDQSLLYSAHPPEDDEVESLFHLLRKVKEEFPEVQGLTSGAILSNYQRNRVEFICDRLGIESLAYLWMRQPNEILDMAHELAVRAILVKTASIGLMPRKLIGKTLEEARPTLEKMTALYQSHLAGEGGEYETTVLNCPLFVKEQLTVRSLEVVMQDDNDISPSGHGVLTVQREAKSVEQQAEDAALLKRLRVGDFHFPSDVLPLLQTLSTSSAALQQLNSLESIPALAESAAAPFSLVSGAARLSMEGHSFRHTVNLSYAAAAAVSDSTGVHADIREGVACCLAEVQKWADTNHSTLFYYHFSLPSASWEESSRAAYTAAVSHVCPPGLLVTVRDYTKVGSKEDANVTAPGEIIVEVLAAPSDTIQRNVLHAQSRSCWALGEPGPYAQGRRIGLPGGGAVVFVSATAGRVPATRALATAHDLPEELCASVNFFLREAAGAYPASGEVVADYVAQFLFAMANCERYLALYRHTLQDVTRATVVVAEGVLPFPLPSLWHWCVGEAAAPFARVCTVATVAALSDGEKFRISMECAEPFDE